ncbi:hypothetical protein H9L10_11880 [Phycicoccus endophyticus]|uniref:Uncharacterized protein n=1 Tax=Phycicoccus endophyticus TaxID=1690220 RepID=A0A7G9R032_9MICO|nr:hypothetical protein [Phycicoccus endophyticus]QNN48957.1 hypothetical protein H9L10_11880 [Phycicoccus endophyticus]
MAPAALLVVVALPVSVATAAAGGPSAVASVALALVPAGAVVLAAHWLTAFRVLPPTLAFLPETGPVVLVLWLLWPPLLSAGAGAVAVRVTGLALEGTPALLVVPGLVVAGVWARALRALHAATGAHRD